MEYPSLDEAVLAQDRIVEQTGGRKGVRDLSLLLSALARPQATFGGKDLYATLDAKAAALVHSLILSHPFVDGNKRTALALLFSFLERNGCRLQTTGREDVDFTLWVEREKPQVDAISRWIAQRLML